MSIWIALVAGLILGWLIEWLIDWVFWRRGIHELYVTESELRAQLAEAESTIDDLRRQLETARSRSGAAPTNSGSSALGSGKVRVAERAPVASQQESARR